MATVAALIDAVHPMLIPIPIFVVRFINVNDLILIPVIVTCFINALDCSLVANTAANLADLS